MKNFVQNGDAISLVAPYARQGGEGVLVGSLFAVAVSDVAATTEGEFRASGVYDITADPAATGTQGAKVYWDDANKRCTTTAASNTLIGALIKAKVATETTVRVRLNGTV